ncbi:MAG: hypothetical protein LBQ00_04335 [Syntrophobacterales bacterium]|jgi:hypothetical protein|nr:hypothetical protein [Syntrophobacterales bacterium]
MEKKDVSQDKGIYGQWHGISYAVNENGDYELTSTAGWEPANVANRQVWNLVQHEIEDVLNRVKNNELSPIAYHTVRCLMDVKILSRYIGFSRFTVRRHFKPHIFKRLDPAILERYARIFGITVEQLQEAPK